MKFLESLEDLRTRKQQKSRLSYNRLIARLAKDPDATPIPTDVSRLDSLLTELGIPAIRAADDAKGVAALRSAEASPPDLADARRKFSVAVAELSEAEVALARRLGALRGELAALGGKASFGSITAIEAEVAAVEKAGRKEIEAAKQAKALAEAELNAAARADAELERLRSKYGHFISDDGEAVAEAA